jgi:tetratricopeptide (TPR) repeat protein
MLATGVTPAGSVSNLRVNLAKLKYGAKDYAGASTALEAIVAADPNNADALVLLAETRNAQGRPAEAVPLLQKAIAARTAAGQPVPKDWSRRAVALAYNGKSPAAAELALAMAKSDPTPTNWRDAIRIYAEVNRIAEGDLMDVYRLQRAAGALKGEADYYRYANGASVKGLPGEAKAVLDEGFASSAIKRNAPAFSGLYPAVSSKVAADKASLAAAERSALAGATARPAMVTGDAYLGYGDYARAAALYRAALTKGGVDKDLANLRLGIALARSGDKAGATAALSSVGGQRQSVARLWLAWLSTRA